MLMVTQLQTMTSPADSPSSWPEVSTPASTPGAGEEAGHPGKDFRGQPPRATAHPLGRRRGVGAGRGQEGAGRRATHPCFSGVPSWHRDCCKEVVTLGECLQEAHP